MLVLGSASAMESAEERAIRLPFRLGELTLFSASLRLRVCDRHFLGLGTDPRATLESLGPLPDRLDGTLLRSHPVEGPQRRRRREGEHLVYVAQEYERSFADLTGTMDDYLARFSGKSRSTLRRKVRKFGELCGGEPVARHFRKPEEMDEFFRHASAVSEKTYQERLLDMGLPRDDAFRAQSRDAAARDAVRAWLLFHGERPVAYLYCPVVEDGVVLYAYLGYDPEYASHSPGTVLQMLAFETLFREEGLRIFDFTEGEGQHKSFFATGSVRCADLYVLRPTLRNRSLLRLHGWTDAISGFAGRALDRIGLKRRIGRWLRRR